MSNERRPVIGVTVDCVDGKPRYRSNMEYAAAVERAGGLPVLLPYRVDHGLIGQYVDLCDGFLFTGGDDLDPSLYGEPAFHPKASPLDAVRQNFELALLAEVERRRRPALGVCLGSQLMNVYRGGSLHQFLPDAKRTGAIEHRCLDQNDPPRHDVKIEPNTELGRVLDGEHVSVNSYHKQGIKQLGRGFKIVATAPDGIIEAFEDPTFPLMAAVQWHPERLIDEEVHLAPFQLLVRKAQSHAPANTPSHHGP